MTLAAISLFRMMFRVSAARGASLRATCFLVAAISLREVHAESVEYEGRTFKVDGVKEIDAEHVAVEVSGQPVVTSRADGGRVVFKSYAQRPELLDRQGVFQGYGSWLVTLVSKGKASEAVMATRHVVISRALDSRSKFGFYEELVARTDGEKTLLIAVSSMDQGEETACGALAFLTKDSQQALTKSASRELDWMTTKCPRALVEIAQEMMSRREPRWGIATLRATATMFSGEGGIADAAQISLERIDALNQALRSQDVSQFDSALKLATFDALLSDYFEKAQPELIAEFSSQALRDGKPTSALQGLSLLDFSLRNNAHHELVAKAMSQLTFADRGIALNSGVRKLLSSYSSKDDLVRRQYLSTLEAWIRLSLDEHNLAEARGLFDVIKELRLDPSVENDTLRGDIAESFIDRGDDHSADALLTELRTELPWSYRFRLLLKRDIYMFTMVALGCVVVLRWGLIALDFAGRKIIARRAAQKAERLAARAAERERYHSQFAEDYLRAQAFVDVDEYAAALKKFRLRPTASLADIKNAYRHVVKTLHPDLNSGSSKEDTDRFIELTRTYERLLVLHAEREQRSKPSG